jgi:ATP-binding cassette subfamily C protein CydD
MLLDEPTAHLDAASEAELIETIRAACHGRTAIIATHSPALAAMADRIVTLGNGQ